MHYRTSQSNQHTYTTPKVLLPLLHLTASRSSRPPQAVYNSGAPLTPNLAINLYSKSRDTNRHLGLPRSAVEQVAAKKVEPAIMVHFSSAPVEALEGLTRF